MCPVTIIVADEGFERVKIQAQTRADWFNQVNIIHTPGNHYMHMQYPQLVADIIYQTT